MKHYYVDHLKLRMERIFQELANKGIVDNLAYARLLDPEDNDYAVQLEDLAICPVFSLLRELADSWEVDYDGDVVASDRPEDQLRASAIARTFDLRPEQLADIYRLSVGFGDDLFGCRDRVLRYVDGLLAA